MSDYIMPVKAIKNILGQELASHYSNACQKSTHDVQRSFIHLGYRILKDKLESAESYDDIQEVLTFADYRMSVQEWINSL